MAGRAISISMNYVLIEDGVCAMLRFVDMLPTVHYSLKRRSSWSSASQTSSPAAVPTAPALLRALLNFILPLYHLNIKHSARVLC